MAKLLFVLREMWRMIRRHRMYFIAPLLITLALMAFLVFYLGPAAIVAFLYAGI
jgi:hypothetical protein